MRRGWLGFVGQWVFGGGSVIRTCINPISGARSMPKLAKLPRRHNSAIPKARKASTPLSNQGPISIYIRITEQLRSTSKYFTVSAMFYASFD
jgi:hypothetical protein